jgi:hypothetical protein
MDWKAIVAQTPILFAIRHPEENNPSDFPALSA